MRRSLMKKYQLRRRITAKDDEGGEYESWDAAAEVSATIWPASGRIQAEMYGERLTYILNMLYEGSEQLSEGDGICVYVNADVDPDYKVISIKQTAPKQIELEKIR